MSIPFSPAVERAWQAAQHQAQLVGLTVPHAQHLLWAMLLEEETRPWDLLSDQGLDVPTLRAELERVTLDNLAGAEHILAAAQILAGERHDDSLTSEVLLLVLLRDDAVLRSHLESRGLAWPALDEAINRSQGPPLDLDQPLEIDSPVDEIATSRALDAAANRAREALRVLEDYIRFALDDEHLTFELKGLRHTLVEALEPLGEPTLLRSRETQRDVGTTLTLGSEQRRENLRHVAQANFKRLQESLRSLEEFSKIKYPYAAQALEQIRYRSYTLERAILGGADRRPQLINARLYVLLTGSQCVASLDWTIAEAAGGGAEMFQLREKHLTDRELLDRAWRVREWTHAAAALFIVNDRPDIARLVRADGVHLGQDDMPIKEARQLLGPEAIIGVSTHEMAQVRQAVLDGADYIGVGPMFASRTKDFTDLAGPEFARQVAAETRIPAFAIGGIGRENIDQVIAAGITRVAVGAAITTDDDPRIVAHTLREALGS